MIYNSETIFIRVLGFFTWRRSVSRRPRENLYTDDLAPLAF